MQINGFLTGAALALLVFGCADDSDDGAPTGTGDASVDAGVLDGVSGDTGPDSDTGDTTAGAGDATDAVAPGTDAADAAVASDAAPDVQEDVPPPPACWDDLAPKEAVVFAEGFAKSTEGAAFGADGALYVTAPSEGTLYRLAGDGQASAIAAVPHALGLALSATGSMLVALKGASNDVAVVDGAVVSVAADGTVTTLTDTIASPNFLVAAKDGSVLVSDDFDTRIFRLLPDGSVEVAVDGIGSPNGMGYSPDGKWLYVASTFTPDGEITRLSVDADGLPDGAERTELAKLGGLAIPDGLAVDDQGRVYVAANFAGEIVRVPPDGSEPEVVASGLKNPASLAFGVAPDFDPCSIYVTELFGDRVWRVQVGARGVPLP